jgi:hypothetical protein
VVKNARIYYDHVTLAKGVAFSVEKHLSLALGAKLDLKLVVPILLRAHLVRRALYVGL